MMNTPMARAAVAILLAAGWMAVLGSQALAQTVINACYVEKTGVLYRIDPDGTLGGNLPTECIKPDKHFQFSWPVLAASGGNIGIGVPEPTVALDVAGDIHATGHLKLGNTMIVDGVANTIASGIDEDISILPGGTGHLGLGTTSPTSDLHIERDANDIVGIVIENRDTGPLSSESLTFRNEDGDLAGIVVHDAASPYPNVMRIRDSRPGGSIQFETAGVPRLKVFNSGRVGIGTTLPSSQLEVAGTVTADAFVGDGSGLTGLSGSLSLNGVHDVTDGFAVTGEFGTGNIPVEGPGARLMWYPGKAAFRAGLVETDSWDDASIGDYSTAMGIGTSATGTGSTAMGLFARALDQGSTAMGASTTASGYRSTAMGASNDATGDYATALGDETEASGDWSTAMGGETWADGEYSTAMGRLTRAFGDYSTAMGDGSWANADHSFAGGHRANVDAAHVGAFLWADGGTQEFVSAAQNEFAVRATGGVRFVSATNATSGAPVSGVRLAPGGSGWLTISDRNVKENFRAEDSEAALAALAAMPVESWNYKAQGPSIRHIGPTAQDFYAAFGLGEDQLRINTVDIDGVNMLAIQALERRTAELRDEVAALRAENDALRGRLAHVEAILLTLRDARR